ncbi:MAG: alpha-amylase, partial [Lachnospiraceae bacterium]|nr:alpha-amylase [Lachnospiraceae bacterium]
TNYHLHKALYSGHNDHNYFEIAHTVKRLYDMGGNKLKLYNFTDNHDVERIYTKLNNKAHFAPTHILTYTLPGVPSVYYGSEFGIEGRKERWSDDSLRPALRLEDFADAIYNNECTKLIARLGKVRQAVKALSYGDYQQLFLTNRQYAFSRNFEGTSVVVTVNNDDSDYVLTLPVGNAQEYIGALSGQKVSVVNGNIVVNVKANFGDIWVPYTGENMFEIEIGKEPVLEDEKFQEEDFVVETEEVIELPEDIFVEEDLFTEIPTQEVVTQEPEVCVEENNENNEVVTETVESIVVEPTAKELAQAAYEKAFEEGRIAGLQEAILAIMERNGYVTDQMRNDVRNQVHIPSLITWVKSFR